MESLVFDEEIASMFSDVVALRRALGVFLRFRAGRHFYPDVPRLEAHRTNGPASLGWARSRGCFRRPERYQRTDARSLAAA